MAPLFLVIALILQTSFIYADIEDESAEVQETPIAREILVNPLNDDEVVKDFNSAQPDFVDMYLFANKMFPSMYPTSAASMMSQVTNNSTNQTCEEQLENVKRVAEQIGLAIQSEIANLMNFAMALNATNKNATDNSTRNKRSVETPMDSTQMIMRLLKHIKANNEYQNIAIEKMMTAQEIADKFGIEFNADAEILSDLAFAANGHAQELTSMLKDVCDVTNATQEIQFIPVDEEPMKNDTFYVYTLHPEEETTQETTVPPFEYFPDIISEPKQSVNHVGHQPEPHCHHHHAHESQIPAPPVHHHSPPVTPRPNFYDSLPYTDYYGYVDPFSSAILIPIEEPEPEPELVGEEIEETITTKLFVERGDEPGSSTVNQVTTYTVAEKTHFRKPQIEQLPQHFQYCFFLI